MDSLTNDFGVAVSALGGAAQAASALGTRASMKPKVTKVMEKDLPLEEIGERYGSMRLVSPRVEQQMLNSLRRYGQMSPVVVCRKGTEGYELIDGFKRLRASRALGGMMTLKSSVLEMGERAAKAAVLCLNWVSGGVGDLEEAWVVQSLCREDGLSQLEVGTLLGRGKSWVSRRLSLVEKLTDEIQSQLRLGLVNATIGRELSRLPRGNQDRVLKAVQDHQLGSREVAGVVELLQGSSRAEQEQILRAPREALLAQGRGSAVARDVRLSKSGNELLRDLSRMEQGCGRVVTRLGSQGFCGLRPGDLPVLAPALGQAERAARHASRVLQETLAVAQGKRDDVIQQP